MSKIELPNKDGFFGNYGGKFVPETLMKALTELESEYNKLKTSTAFQKQIDKDYAEFVGRPSPLYFAERLTKKYKGPKIWLKREDLNPQSTGCLSASHLRLLLAAAKS